MDLWQGRLADFVNSARSGALAGAMSGQYAAIHGHQPGEGEFRSWRRSLGVLGELLQGSLLVDVGVAVGDGANAQVEQHALVAEGRGADVGVCTEYHLPLQARRVDVMLFGQDSSGDANSLVVELKQWSQATLEDEHAVNVLAHGRELAHPSQQALDYALYLSDYHGAFARGQISAVPLAWCHEMSSADSRSLRDLRFEDLLDRSPLYAGEQRTDLLGFLSDHLSGGNGMDIMHAVSGGEFRPSQQVIECLEAVIRHDEEWHLLDAQRVAHGAILAEVQRLQRRGGRRAILVRGGPGTGKTVIAIQLMADALRMGLKVAHSTGGKAFTMTLRSRFRGAGDLFLWNMNLRKAPPQGLDLLLVDEAHRVRETSDTRWTKKIDRTGKSQIHELLDAAKVTVFLLDENQYMRPDEIGTTALVESSTSRLNVPLKRYDLQTQFRCGGCEEYVAWVDQLLGFREPSLGPWDSAYALRLVDCPTELDELVQETTDTGGNARIVAGFCWTWSKAESDGSLVRDVVIGNWERPWNEKPNDKKSYRPDKHPYTLWATTEAGLDQVGCIYSAQGFEFDRVGVIWGEDLVWRKGEWRAQKESSHDRPVRSSSKMLDLVRNAYRVLLTRGIRGTSVLCLDLETREHLKQSLESLS